MKTRFRKVNQWPIFTTKYTEHCQNCSNPKWLWRGKWGGEKIKEKKIRKIRKFPLKKYFFFTRKAKMVVGREGGEKIKEKKIKENSKISIKFFFLLVSFKQNFLGRILKPIFHWSSHFRKSRPQIFLITYKKKMKKNSKISIKKIFFFTRQFKKKLLRLNLKTYFSFVISFSEIYSTDFSSANFFC